MKVQTILLTAVLLLGVATRVESSVPCMLLGQAGNLQSLAVNPNEVFGGGSTTGTVTLSSPAGSGGSTVSLSTSSGVICLPATVTVVEGTTAADFEITIGHVSQTYVRTITASSNGVNRTAFVTLHPGLRTVVVLPREITGGSPTQGGVQLWGDAPSGGVEVIVSDNSGSVHTPSSVTIPAGEFFTTFGISTTQVNADATRLVFATLNGVTKAGYIKLTAGPRIASFTISPSTVRGGGDSAIGEVTLTGPAPSGGRRVQVTDNSAAVTPSVNELSFASGAVTGTFFVSTLPVTATYTRKVTVSMGGTIRIANITITP